MLIIEYIVFNIIEVKLLDITLIYLNTYFQNPSKHKEY
jgi:hypothetical protein